MGIQEKQYVRKISKAISTMISCGLCLAKKRVLIFFSIVKYDMVVSDLSELKLEYVEK